MIMKAYHGTCANIKEFDLNHCGEHTCNNGGAVFFTTDKEVAWNYSKEAFCRKNEDLIWENKISHDLLIETSEKQAHFYEVELNIKKPLYIDIKTIENKWSIEYHNIYNCLNACLLNHIINLLQNRQYEHLFETYDRELDEQAMYYLLDYEIIEKYDAELDDYIEKDHDFDCIIIKNCIDSINDYTDYIESDIIAVLDTDIITIKDRLKDFN